MSSPFISVILVAGGKGLRMGTPMPKQYLSLAGKPVVLHSFALFAELPLVREIIVVCEEQYQSFFPNLTHPRVRFALPGARRQDSVWNGLCQVARESELLCIHDSARPLLNMEDCHAVLEAGRLHGAAVLATPVKYTIKSGTSDNFVQKTLDRSTLWDIQTPQVVAPDLLRQGFSKARAQNDIAVTDDVSLVELLGHPVKLVKGSDSNIKITTPTDLALAESLLSDVVSV